MTFCLHFSRSTNSTKFIELDFQNSEGFPIILHSVGEWFTRIMQNVAESWPTSFFAEMFMEFLVESQEIPDKVIAGSHYIPQVFSVF